ncbi:hypothetical protein CR513_11721, partial [Mucuna pruriens]
MVTMFIDTLPSPYYDKVVGNVASSFADLVVVGERIELGIRRGKKKVKPVFPQGKANPPSYPTQIHVGGSRWAATYANPPPMPYVPPYQLRTDAKATASSKPTQQTARRAPRALAPIPMTYTGLLPFLLKEKLLEVVPLKPLEPPYPRSYDPNVRCDYHSRVVGHATERCWSLKHKFQDLIEGGYLGFQNQGPNVQDNPLPTHRGVTINAISHENRDEGPQEVELEETNRRGREEAETGGMINSASRVEEGSHQSWPGHAEALFVAYVEGNDNPRPKPLIIHYNLATQLRVSFIIQVPARPAYNNNVVPWKYPAEERSPPAINEDPTPEVTNITGTEGVTRSRRIFTLGLKDKAVEAPKKLVTEGETTKFLKLICHSEYERLEQLHRMKVRVSLLSLLINSEGYYDLLLKVLSDAHMAQDITLEKFAGIINNIMASRHLSFSEDEVPTKGRSHNQPLHITVKCENYMIVRVLIDNGSSLNVMPKTTLDKLYSTGSTLKTSLVVIRAFDRSKREVMGEITLLIHIRPTTFDIIFQVIVIQPAYSFLLGRPWIHIARVVPSSPHQKYIKGDKEALETSFQALKIVGTTNAEAEEGGPKLSRPTIMVAKVLISNDFQPSKGLDKELDGTTEPVALQENPRRFELSYTETAKEGRPGRRAQGKKWIQSDLYHHFTSGGIISPNQIGTIEDQLPRLEEWVIPTNQELDN